VVARTATNKMNLNITTKKSSLEVGEVEAENNLILSGMNDQWYKLWCDVEGVPVLAGLCYRLFDVGAIAGTQFLSTMVRSVTAHCIIPPWSFNTSLGIHFCR